MKLMLGKPDDTELMLAEQVAGAWRPNPDDTHSLSDSNVRAIHRDRGGMVWLGTYDGGLNRFDPASGIFTLLPLVTGLHPAGGGVSLDPV